MVKILIKFNILLFVFILIISPTALAKQSNNQPQFNLMKFLFNRTSATATPEISYIRENNKNINQLGKGYHDLIIRFNKNISLGDTKIKLAYDLGSNEITAVYSRQNRTNEIETQFDILDNTVNGNYLLLFNDISYEVYVKTTPPILDIVYPENNLVVNDSSINIIGSSETNIIWINRQKKITSRENSFKTLITLTPGLNTIEAISTDEANNSSIVLRNIYYNYKPPILISETTKEIKWNKCGSTIALNINANDLQNDISDQIEACVSFDGKIIDSSLIYSKDHNKISGFASLSTDMPNGKNILTVSLSDNDGNSGSCNYIVYIDKYPPMLKTTKINNISNCKDKIAIPISDPDSGICESNTSITVYNNGRTVEGHSVLNKNTGTLTFLPYTELSDGRYNIYVSSADIAGNYSPKTAFDIQIDSNAVIMAESVQNISGFLVCPNPFNPGNGERTNLTYTLANASDIKIYIFDSLGKLIWKNQATGVVGYNNNIFWNGQLSSGENAENGVYYAYISALDNTGETSTSKSKIIVLR